MASFMKYPTLQRPTRKVTHGAVIGMPTGVVLVWVLQTFILPKEVVPIPGEVSVALGSIISFIVSYFVKETD